MSEHPWLDDAAAYALGSLSPEERAAFEAHLAGCATCQSELDELRDVAGLLAHATPTETPRPELRDRILQEARREKPRGARRSAGWAPWLAAAVLAVFAGLGYWRAEAQRVALESALDATRAELAARDSLLGTLLAPDVATAALTATGQPPSARLFWNRNRDVVVLTAFDLPPAPAGRTYQLWGIVSGEPPISLGVFNTEPDGRATITLPVPGDLDLDLSAVTEEPAGGSPQPTSTPFLVGPWQTTD